MVDAITTSLCIESASPDVPSYAKALKNVVSLLKPGGMLVIMGIYNSSWYVVGDKVFKKLEMQKQDVHNVIEAAGLKVLKVYDDDSFSDGPVPYKGSAILHAQKNA